MNLYQYQADIIDSYKTNNKVAFYLDMGLRQVKRLSVA